MPRRRLRRFGALVRERLVAAFSEDHPPGDVAATFAVGLFVASLPNLGLALVLFAAMAYSLERVSKLALVAAVVVMNPPAKWAVYLASLWLGNRLLGPVPGATIGEFSLSRLAAVGPEVLLRLLVGNLVISTVLAVVGYVLAVRFVRELRRREIALLDGATSAE